MVTTQTPASRRPRMFGRRATGDPMSWRGTVDRLIVARNYWVTVCLPGGWPYARPVWGVWVDAAFWYSTSSRAVPVVAGGTHAAVHTESGDDVVIVEGDASIMRDLTARRRFVDAYNAKYQWNLEVTGSGVGDDAGASGQVIAVEPRRIYAWTTSDLQTATCWDFETDQGA